MCLFVSVAAAASSSSSHAVLFLFHPEQKLQNLKPISLVSTPHTSKHADLIKSVYSLPVHYNLRLLRCLFIKPRFVHSIQLKVKQLDNWLCPQSIPIVFSCFFVLSGGRGNRLQQLFSLCCCNTADRSRTMIHSAYYVNIYLADLHFGMLEQLRRFKGGREIKPGPQTLSVFSFRLFSF